LTNCALFDKSTNFSTEVDQYVMTKFGCEAIGQLPPVHAHCFILSVILRWNLQKRCCVPIFLPLSFSLISNFPLQICDQRIWETPYLWTNGLHHWIRSCQFSIYCTTSVELRLQKWANFFPKPYSCPYLGRF